VIASRKGQTATNTHAISSKLRSSRNFFLEPFQVNTEAMEEPTMIRHLLLIILLISWSTSAHALKPEVLPELTDAGANSTYESCTLNLSCPDINSCDYTSNRLSNRLAPILTPTDMVVESQLLSDNRPYLARQCSQRVGPFVTQNTAWQRWREARNQGYAVSNGVVPCYSGGTRGYCFFVYYNC